MSKFYMGRMLLPFSLFCLMLLFLLSGCDQPSHQVDQSSQSAIQQSTQEHQSIHVQDQSKQLKSEQLSTVTQINPLQHDVYIWQRQWTPQHAMALQETRPYFHQLRILAAQQHPKEGWVVSKIDFALLKQQPQAKIAVIRLDGRLLKIDQAKQIQQIMMLLQAWQSQGIQLQGVEIDYDCPSSRLAEYQQFIIQIRQALAQLPQSKLQQSKSKQPKLQLSITALPDWLNRPEQLQQLLRQVDHSVLQVHAVQQATQGLFNANVAEQWIRQYARLTAHDFYVALPAYHAQVTLSGQVESEVRLAESGTRQDLLSDVKQVASLIQKIENQRVKPVLAAQRLSSQAQELNALSHLQGWVWFRLPLPQDRNVWTWQSLKKVITKQTLVQQLEVESRVKSDSGQTEKLYDIYLKNVGDSSLPIPSEITFEAQQCISSDVLTDHFTLEIQPQQIQPKQIKSQQIMFKAVQINAQQPIVRPQIRAGQQMYLGWLRCHNLSFKHFE